MNLNLLKNKLSLALMLLFVSAFNAYCQVDTTVLIVAQDIYVGEKEPVKNFNGVTDMGVSIDEVNSDSRETYLTFDISSLYGKGPVMSVNLNFVAAVKSDAPWIPLDNFYIDVFECKELWTETEMTWDNKPKSETEAIAQGNIHLEAIRYHLSGTEIDKTAVAKFIAKAMEDGLQTVSFAIKAREETPGSRIWLSDKGWEPAKLSVMFEDVEVYVSDITVTGANNATSITVDDGTLQMSAAVLPEDADIKDVVWSVTNETGKASISKTGLLSGVSNGTVTVKADAIDGSWEQGTLDVVISGQVINKDDIWNDLNLIRNWNTTTDLVGWGGYVDLNVAGQAVPVVEEGITVMKVGIPTDNAPWRYQHTQNQLQAEPNVPYILSFKSWASNDAPAVVDFEDTEANTYNRYGASSDPLAISGRSEWHYNLTIEPQWFTFHVTFDQIVETTDQKLQFMLALSEETIYLDSVILVKEPDFALLTSSKKLASSIVRVYPNPVGNSNILYVDLAAVNSKVAIYNALGQKIMEKVATGNTVKFDVSSLRQGMYIVRLSDGTSQKFIR